MKTKWSTSEDEWLLQNYRQYETYSDLASALNRAFGNERTSMAIKCRLAQAYGTGLGRTTQVPYNNQEKMYIKENFKSKTLSELAEGLNKLTGRKVSGSGVSHYMANTLGITRCGRNSRLQKGDTIGKVCELYAEYVNNDGYTLVKVSETGIKNNDWKTKQSLIWEQLYGSKPDGIVVFLNRDRSDFRKENLYCVSRKIHAIMCSNNWYTASREHTLTAIKWCELYFALKKEARP